MFASTKISEIFPTPIWVVDLEASVHEPLNAGILATVKKLAGDRPAIRPGATWQTDPYIHRLPEFAEIARIIRAAAEAAFDSLNIEKRPFSITGCWVNINPKGGLNTRHTHPNNFLSGTYYVQVPDGAAARIVFDDPRPQAMTIMPRVTRHNKFMGNEIGVDVKAGRLVLFPAWLSHGVPANPDELERITVSFNLMFDNYTEAFSQPLWRGTVGPRLR
jgi:uncharacterized protein (TIGR02466 family)